MDVRGFLEKHPRLWTLKDAVIAFTSFPIDKFEEYLSFTKQEWLINWVLRGNNADYHMLLISNPNLNLAQVHSLHDYIEGLSPKGIRIKTVYLTNLIKNQKAIDVSMLMQIASRSTDRRTLEAILAHPSLTDEIKVMIALRLGK